jgi:hypothetical protein
VSSGGTCVIPRCALVVERDGVVAAPALEFVEADIGSGNAAIARKSGRIKSIRLIAADDPRLLGHHQAGHEDDAVGENEIVADHRRRFVREDGVAGSLAPNVRSKVGIGSTFGFTLAKSAEN